MIVFNKCRAFLLLIVCVNVLYGFHTKVSRVSSSVRAVKGFDNQFVAGVIGNLLKWYEMDDCLVLLPPEPIPKSVVHFVGGFIAGSSVQVAYSGLLNQIAQSGHLVLATPIPAFETNHDFITEDIVNKLSLCYRRSIRPLIKRDVPLIGLSHSLGGKLTTIMNSRKQYRKVVPPRVANIFMSYNNFGLLESMQLMKGGQLEASSDALGGLMKTVGINGQVLGDLGDIASSLLLEVGGRVRAELGAVDFTPSPQETWALIEQGYNIPANVLMQFSEDSLDQSELAAQAMRRRGAEARVERVRGNHLTPTAILDAQGEKDVKGEDWDFVRRLVGVLDELTQAKGKYALPAARASSSQSALPSSQRQKWDSDNF